jgi:tetraacyldisaccharide 4'-kinase
VIVSDDGLQHYRLARDAEIAVVDGTRKHGNGFLLPAGPLREPPARLHSVDAVVIRSREEWERERPEPADVLDAPRFAMSMIPGAFYQLGDPQHTEIAGGFRGQRVHAAAGIGNPQHFFSTLKTLGLAFTAHAFPDHFSYTQGDLEFAGCDAVVMTEKDAVKYEPYATGKHWVLGITAQVENGLAPLLIKRLHEHRQRKH